ncbi:hypothetical protein CHLRE_12g546100v5 [Chlamydomonas reinhardtii]|uniref:Kinesin motor domain-containing protein n=2 Tax=Chlamydomonas reinhardtii TaxID=3055 RepID=A0A2K3D6I6_CHLRE|nr:uncharacterized protein CHLRE_12g546100v5 [Chlamydomonas reinhardtii]PNW76143.1 hypothetical protein CHLRE_12g546100v5 [Chlamydomonas reinhardtii]
MADSRSSRFKVYVRLRPSPGASGTDVVQAEHRVLTLKDPVKGHSSEFVFDKVFDAEARQESVFADVGVPLVEHVIQGYNACCFAYGQTGAGKTHSMYGREGCSVFAQPGTPEHGDLGVIPRACELLWKAASQVNRKAEAAAATGGGNSAPRIKLFVSFMEIYLDQIRDLGAAAQAHLKATAARSPPPIPGDAAASAGLGLSAYAADGGGAPGRSTATSLGAAADYVRTNLDVLEDSSGMTFVKDLTFMEVSCVEDMLAVLRAGYALRATSATAANDVSSRSHTVFTVSVVTYRGEQQPVTGRLNLVDLAGSERQSKSGAEGARLKEMSAINKSLTALGKVVMTLSQGAAGGGLPHAASGGIGLGGAPHVPFRDSKLTRVLKDSLTGNSFTCLLACLHPAPENVEECGATLQFAVQCSSIATAPRVNVLSSGGPGGDAGVVEDLMTQVAHLKDELEVTHAHYQKLLESVAGPSWRNDPGPIERAPGGPELGGGGGGMDAFASMLSAFGTKESTSGAAPGYGGGGGGGLGGVFASGGFDNDRRRLTSETGRARGGDTGRTHGVAKSVVGGSASVANSRVSVLEAQVRKLEGQLAQARSTAQQYEERLTARKEEMEAVRERMAGKEHAQFSEIKKLRAQVSDLTKQLDAERTDSNNKLEDARRRSEEECARLMKDIDVLRSQLAQVTGSVGGLVEKHTAAISAEKRQRDAARKHVEQLMQQQAARGSEEHKAQVENLKQQSSYFLSKQAEQMAELKAQLDVAKATFAVEKDGLLAELDYLSSYSERVTELVRRMEAGAVPVHDRGNGIKAFRLPQRDRPPRLDAGRLGWLKDRNGELHERLMAISAATAAAGGSTAGSSTGGLSANQSTTSLHNTASGRHGGLSVALPGSGAGHSALGSTVDLDALRAQVEAELKAQVTAQVMGDMKSDKTIEYIRELEVAVGRYRAELQTEKKRNSEMAVALRSVQRIHQRPESPMNKALAAHSPAGTLKLAPSWGLGHAPGSPQMGLNGMSRPGTAGLVSLAGGSPKSGNSTTRRPSTSMTALTSGYRENGLSIP